MAQNSNRNVTAQRIRATLNGKNLPSPLMLEIGNQGVYNAAPDNSSAIGSYVGYRPTLLRMTLPITKNKLLRDISKSEAEMQKDHKMTIRWLATDAGQPLTSTELVNVRFTSIVQRRRNGLEQPVEEVVAIVESVSHTS